MSKTSIYWVIRFQDKYTGEDHGYLYGQDQNKVPTVTPDISSALVLRNKLEASNLADLINRAWGEVIDRLSCHVMEVRETRFEDE